MTLHNMAELCGSVPMNCWSDFDSLKSIKIADINVETRKLLKEYNTAVYFSTWHECMGKKVNPCFSQ